MLRKVRLQRKGYTESIAWEGQASEKGLYGDNCFGRSCFRERVILRELLRKVRLQTEGCTERIA